MPLFSVIVWLLLGLGPASPEVQLSVPDSLIERRFEQARAELARPQTCADAASCDDVAIQALALTALGNFDEVRSALAGVQQRTPLWLLAAYQYWLASADDAFLREQWWSIKSLLFAPQLQGTLNDGGVLLAAVDGMMAMARVMNDSTARERGRSIHALAEQRAQENPGLFAPALGLLNAELTDAHLTRLVDTVHARWPVATGLVALGLYENHRDSTAFSLVQNMAEQDGAPAMFTLPILRGLLGWEADARHRALALEPHLPAGWDMLGVQQLGFGKERISLEIRRADGSYVLQLARTAAGPPIMLHIAPAFPRGTRIRSVKVNDEDVPTHIESNAHDVHVVIEAQLRQEASIEIEYDRPQRRASAN